MALTYTQLVALVRTWCNRDEEVVSDDDPILEIKKEDENEDNEEDIAISDDINFIEDTDNTDEDETSVEIIEDQKD